MNSIDHSSPAAGRRVAVRSRASVLLFLAANLLCFLTGSALAQTSRTWNGSVSTDWFNASNWTPSGVPSPNDILTFSSGTIDLTAQATISNQFTWSGGTLSGSPLSVAPGGVLTLSGTGTRYLQNILTNAGTVNWEGNGTLYIVNNNSSQTGVIYNLAGAVWNFQTDPGNLSCYYCNAYELFYNAGTLEKTGGTGTTSISVPVLNSGLVAAQTGVLDFQNGGTIQGTFNTSTGATIAFTGGAFSYSTAPVLSGAGLIEMTGGNLTLVNDTLANLQMVGGTITLAAGFQGGSITNLSLPGALLNGNYTVGGTFNCGGGVSGSLLVTNGGLVTWSGGTISGNLTEAIGAVVNWGGGSAGGPVLVDSGATLVLGGNGTKYLFNTLTNAGTVVWTNGTIYVANNGGSQLGAIENLSGASWTIQCDQSLAQYYGNTNAYFHNLGTVQKLAGTGTTSISIPIYNEATIAAQEGTINFQNGEVIEGSFDAASGAAIDFSGGNFVYNTPPMLSGAGSFVFNGGTLTLVSNVIPNLQMTGGTLVLSTNFQGGSITNLTFSGVLSGNYVVSGTLNLGNGDNGSLTVVGGGTLNWSGGTITGNLSLSDGSALNWTGGTLNNGLEVVVGSMVDWGGGSAGGPVLVDSGATLVLGGNGTKYLFNTLTNAGTVLWTNGTIYVANNGGSQLGAIENLSGASWTIQCDQSLAQYYGNTNAYFHNLGTVQKLAGTGTTSISIPIYNEATIAAQEGTINFQNGEVIEGSFNAASGAAIDFTGGNFVYNTPPVMNGAGSFVFDGGTLTLVSNVIPNLQMTGGTLVLSTNFQGGSITNLTFSGVLSGNYVVSGTLNLGNGDNGSLTVAAGGTLNWSGGTITGNLSLSDGSALNWTGGTLNNGLEVVVGSAVDWGGGFDYGPVLVDSGATLLLGGNGTKYLFNTLTNAGTVVWTNGTIYVANNGGSQLGAIENLSGAIWTIQCDQGLAQYYGNTNGYFHNLGTVQKLAGTGTTSISIPMYNEATIAAQEGTINFQNGEVIEGSFNAASGAAINFTGGNFVYNTPPVMNGAGSFVFNGGTLNLASNVIPNLQMTGGTLVLSTNFQGGSITNLTSGATLNGNYIVGGTFNCGGGVSGSLIVATGGVLNWTGGTITGNLTEESGGLIDWQNGTASGQMLVTNGATLLLGGTGAKYLFNVLTNSGTVTWTNGSMYLANDGRTSFGGIENLAGALWDIQCNQSLGSYYSSTNAYFQNLGTIQKSAGGGSTYVSVLMLNAGLLNILNGTINFNSANTYFQTGPTLGFGISGAGQGTPMIVSGNLSLDGTLSGTLLNQYMPAAGDAISLIACGTLTNSFNSINLPPIGASLAWGIAYAANGVSLQVVSNLNTTAQITGTVKDNIGNAVSGLTVFAFTTNSSNSLYLSSTTDINGSYVLNVSNGVWRAGLEGLVARGYNNVPTQDVVVNGANQVVNFVVQPYTGQSYTITVTSSPAAGGSAAGGGTFLPGSPVTLTATPNTSSLPYFFAGWTENGVLESTLSPYVFQAERNRSIVANFTLPSFTIAVSNNPPGGGVVSGAGTYFYASTNVLIAQPNFGYNFGSWSESGVVLGTTPTLTTVVYSNRNFAANYTDANTNHTVITATQPPGIAVVTGAGTYTNGQSVTFTTPAAFTSGAYDYFFQDFTLTNVVVSGSSSFTKVFETTDPTNLEYVAVYAQAGAVPAVTNVTVNYVNPVLATTNFQLGFEFDRTMNTNIPPSVRLTNSASGAIQAVVSPGGRWASTVLSNDTFYPPPITFTQGMDGAIQVLISGAQDPLGGTLSVTNVYTVQLDATPPVLSNVAAAPSVLSAFVTWTSDKPSSSLVEYGTSPAYGLSSGLYGQLVTSHGVTLYNLSPVTTYHYRVHSRDLAGNETISGDNTFTTFAAPDLQVTNLQVTGSLVSGGNIVISWADTNSGSGATFTYWYDQIIVTNASTGQTLLNSAVFYDPTVNGIIAPGGFQARQLNFTLPNGLSGAGNLRAIVTVNAYGNQYEANGSGTAQLNNTGSVAFSSALSAYPDLQITGLAITNSQVHSGNTVGLVWNDANTGNGAVGNSFYDLVVVVNQTTAQTLVNTVLPDNAGATPIPPNQSVPRQFSFALPDGTPGVGTLQITIVADIYNNVFEYNASGTAKSNNTNSTTVASTLAAYPDLAVTNVLVPVSANAGQAISVSWTESNQGTAPATNIWYDQVFLTGVDTIGSGQLLGSFAFTNGLAVNQSTNITQTVTLPQFVQGNQWIVVKANALASFFELNTANNSSISTQAVVVAPTLALSLSASSIAESAGTNSVIGTLTRGGNVSAPLTVNLSTLTGTNVYVPSSVLIPAGQSGLNFQAGPFDNFISGPPVAEKITATASGFPPASAPLSILENDPATLSLVLTATSVNDNAGVNAVTGTVTRNANFASAVTVLLGSDTPGILTVPASVTIPAGQASAAFGLSPVPTTALGDAQRVNISATAAGFSSVSTPITVLNVNSLALGLTLQNPVVSKGAGNSADVGTVSMPSARPNPQNILLTVSNSSIVTIPTVVTIPAGSTSVDFTISVGNDGLVTGTQTATLLAQALTPLQLALTNGEAMASLQILDVNGPTLSLSLANSTISKGSNTTATVTRNTPATNALAVTLSSAPTGIVSLPASVTIPLSQTSATFTVTGILDNQQTGTEQVSLGASAAGFNPGSAPLAVSDIYLPDLLPTSVTFPTTAQTGGQLTVNWVVANQGLGAATNQAWSDYIYLGSDNLGQHNVLVATVPNKSGLPIGASYTNQTTIPLPATPGNYWVSVVADAANAITELNKQNNTLISSAAVSINPAYRAAITNVTPTVAPQGTPIVLSGWTYTPGNNQPMPNSYATVSIQVNGTTRNYPVASDNTGSFSFTFQPLGNEAGDYAAGADYPYLPSIAPQVSFVLLGMQATPANLSFQLLPVTPLTTQLVLSNLTDQPLTGLAIAVPNLQGNLSAQFSFTNTTLPAFGALTVNVTLQSPLTHSAQIRFTATVTSAEGAQLSLPVTANVVPLVPQLIANPAYLTSGMVVGQQASLSFDVLNTGGASSGDLTVQLPTNLTWMALGSPATIPSIPAGGKATVVLLLNPPGDLPITLYTGNLSLFNGGTGVSVPFQIRAVSESTGDVRVTVTDDYTYYVAGSPNVTNAVVTVRDPFTSAVVAQTNTDMNGIAEFPALPAGPYTVDATAPEHSQYRGSVSVVPGITNNLEAFMARELITYQWTVVPTQVADQYQIVLQSVFQTQVPVPNLVISEPQVLVPVVPNEASQFVITMSNEGLIEAQNVAISVPDDPTYLVTPLVTNLGIVPAQTTVEVPVTVQLRSAPAPGLARPNSGPQPLGAPGCGAVNTFAGCFPDIPLVVTYSVVCGNNNDQQSRSIDLKALCTDSAVKQCLDAFKSTATSENIYALACNAVAEFLTCAGINLSPCQKAALSTTCGALTGGVAGAAGAGGGDLIQCACDLLKNVSLPSPPSSPPPPVGCLDCGTGGGGGPGWTANGGGWSTVCGGGSGNCSSGGAQIRGNATAPLLVSFPHLRLPQRRYPEQSQSVCATVRIQIDQDVVMSRSAFAGTLELDNGGSTALTGVQVNLVFQDATNGDASSKFVIEGPTLSTLTAVDGTGSLAAGATGSAVYTFIPTDDAAPDAPATYQIGGTLTYTDNGQQVTVPLLSAPITVYPEAKLDLLYFQQRDVYGLDPLDPALSEPPQPFDLGLIVKNVGAGMAHSFQITSGQPQIVDNEKGLLINFTIIGTEVGDQPLSPSLSASLGDLSPGTSKEVNWDLLSTLAGKFISFEATFQHVDDMGNTNTSLINSVEIHSLTHRVLADRPTDDDIPDFLVNDIPNPESLPDTLYLSDGTIAAVNVVTNGTFDGPAAPGHLQVQLTTTVSNGWNYIQLPDPGVGYILTEVVRSDGLVIPMTNDAWTTSLSFPSSSTAPVVENLVHLFDWAGPGAYTLYYHSTNTTPPAIVQVGPVTPFTQSGAISSVQVVFSEPVNTSTFSYTNLNLSLNGGANLIASGTGISLSLVSGNTYSINGLATYTAADGNYQLTVLGAGIYDLWNNNAGNVSASTQWAKGNVAPVVQSITPISPNPRNTPVSSVTVNFSKPINAGTFTSAALSLTLNGGPNLITSAVTITPVSSTSFTVSGLGPLTGAQGNYLLTVNAAVVQDTGGLAGFGTGSAGWTMITTGPTITALETINTNPRNIVVQDLQVTFSEPINPATFDYTDISLTRDGGPNLITSAVQVDQVSPTTFLVTNISWVQGYAGSYSFTVNASGVSDLAGNSGSGSTNESWQLVLEIPATPTNLAITPNLGVYPGLTSTNDVTLSGTVGASNLTVRIYDATTSTDLGTANVVGTNFSIYLTFTVEGLHVLQANAIDSAGNASLGAFFNLFLDVVPPTAVIQQAPNPDYAAVSTIPVTFSKPINTNTLSATNFVVTFNGASPFTPTLTEITSNSFLLGNLASYTAPLGVYQVALNLTGVRDLAGNTSTNVIVMSWVRGTTNLPPFIPAIPNMVVAPDGAVVFAVNASDPDGDVLTYSLASGAPGSATLDPVKGLFSWKPGRAYAETTNSFTVIVTDNGSPPMSTNETFSVIVLDYLQVSLGSTNLQQGQTASVPVSIASNDGATNVVFTVQVPENLLTNWTITPLAPQLASATLLNQKTNIVIALQTAAGQVLQGTQLVSTLSFLALPSPLSSFVALPPGSIKGLKPAGLTYSNYVSQAGSVALIESQPLLVSTLSNQVSRFLTVYGRTGTNYLLEFRTNLVAGSWQSLSAFTQTNAVINLNVSPTNSVIFYRLQQQ